MVHLDIDLVLCRPFECSLLDGEDCASGANLNLGRIFNRFFWSQTEIVTVALVTETEALWENLELLVS